ncbi:helix-turn-helix domain-containing protein [Phenylobacterium deserti]|nr:helix-turn-helix transcriptional regulator [Phenylobacterium deserti]
MITSGGPRPETFLQTAPETDAAASLRRERVLRDRPFALRLQKACDRNAHVPAYNRGRQAWVRSQLVERFDTNVSVETVSKWFTGVARPRANKIGALAKLLNVDEAWLAEGAPAEAAPEEPSVASGPLAGAVKVLGGFIQMSGGYPAPQIADPAPDQLHMVINGAHHAFQVVLGEPEGMDAYRFAVPEGGADRVVIGVVPREPLRCDFLELRADLLEAFGARRSGFIDVALSRKPQGYFTGDQPWPQITSFGDGV